MNIPRRLLVPALGLALSIGLVATGLAHALDMRGRSPADLSAAESDAWGKEPNELVIAKGPGGGGGGAAGAGAGAGAGSGAGAAGGVGAGNGAGPRTRGGVAGGVATGA